MRARGACADQAWCAAGRRALLCVALAVVVACAGDAPWGPSPAVNSDARAVGLPVAAAAEVDVNAAGGTGTPPKPGAPQPNARANTMTPQAEAISLRAQLRVAQRKADSAAADIAAADARAKAAQDELRKVRTELTAEKAKVSAMSTKVSNLEAAKVSLQQRLNRESTAAAQAKTRAAADAKAAAASTAKCDCDAQDTKARPSDPRGTSNKDMPEAVRRLYEKEKARQRRIQHDDADSADNGPKEITLYCPKDMQIGIADLNEDERDNNECMVLNLNGPGVSSRLVLFCDGTQHQDFDAEPDHDTMFDEDEAEAEGGPSS